MSVEEFQPITAYSTPSEGSARELAPSDQFASLDFPSQAAPIPELAELRLKKSIDRVVDSASIPLEKLGHRGAEINSDPDQLRRKIMGLLLRRRAQNGR
jgi:hypothetical protein